MSSSQLTADIIYAFRVLRRNRAFAIGASLTIALGIGATTATYAVVYGVLLRPLPVRDEGSLVVAYAVDGIRRDAPISYPRYVAWRDSGAFEDLAAVTSAAFDLEEGVAERVRSAGVTGNFFRVLGANAALGRTLTAADAAGAPTPAVISDALWRRRFAADPAIIGRPVRAGEGHLTIVGVMPPRFDRWRGEAHIWVPLEEVRAPSILASPGYHIATPIGRLHPHGAAAVAGDRLAGVDRELAVGDEMRLTPADGSSVRLVTLRHDVVPARVERLVLFGTLPAIRSSSLAFARRWHERRPSGRHLTGALIAVQIACALVVLVGALLLAKSVWRMKQVPLGFDPARVLVFRVSLPEARYGKAAGTDDPRYLPAQREMLERLSGIGGVEAASIGNAVFLPGNDRRTSVSFDDGRRLLNGNPKDLPLAPGLHFVGPKYFRVHGVRILAGREFSDGDDFTAPRRVIVNETMARVHWPGQNPIGRRVNFGSRRRAVFDEPWAEVIGVVADIRHAGVDVPVKPEVYRASWQYPHSVFDVMLRTSIAPQRVATEIRDVVQAFDSGVPVFAIRPLSDTVDQATAESRYSATLLGLFAGIAAVLCALGVYSVFAYAVARQQRELGIRIALGATSARMEIDVLWRMARVVSAGLAAGVLLAFASSRLLASLLYEVSPRDPAAIVAAVCALEMAALVGAWLPARRAGRVDPIVVLRAE
ncbi:MAG: hypothetical protein A3G21_10725 [Acidobacteria bacterium RIFCSPLOWO2_12_FULL_66_21]|nr:MAG: hypothetical protein A3G21_10725 [Acidobacteria bacterium RIFCSPLOWO2_12_FULL_66_21]